MVDVQIHGSEILVAEDDPDDRLLITNAMKKAGMCMPLQFVTNGVELFDHLDACAARSTPMFPGLILLDINMPKMNGREVLERRRDDIRLAQIPIVVLTTSTAEPEILDMYRLGANSFISKPLDMGVFVKVVRGVVEYWFETVALPARSGTAA